MKLISSKVMEAVLQNDYGIETEDFVHRYASWIADALDIIDIKALKIHKVDRLKRDSDGNLFVPCDKGNLDSLIIKSKCGGIEYLKITNFQSPCCCFDGQFNSRYSASYIDYNKIKTNYDGEVFAAFIDRKVDAYGNPMIPDNAEVKQAIGYYILHKMCMTGYEHKTINFETAYQLWEKHYPRASNDINWMNSQEHNEFTNMWTNIYQNLYNLNS